MTEEIIRRFPGLPEADKKNAFDSFYQNMKIIADHKNIDSVRFYMDQYIDCEYKSRPQGYFGTQTLEQAKQNNQKLWLKPRLMAYIRFEPEKYYPTIRGPKLILCGTLDEKVDCSFNLNAFRTMFKGRSKLDWQIIAVDRVNHALHKVDNTSTKAGEEKDQNFSQEVWGIVVDWVHKI